MKPSIILTIGIVAVGVLSGLLIQIRLSEARDHRHEIASEAERLGIPSLDRNERQTKTRIRAGDTDTARKVSDEVMKIARELDAKSTDMTEVDLGFETHTGEVIAKLRKLKPDELKMVMRDLREAEELSASNRGHLMCWLLYNLTSDDPETVAGITVESLDVIKGNTESPDLISDILKTWAERDGAAASAWLLKTSKSNPDFLDDRMKQSLVEGTARTDIRLALSMVAGLELKDVSTAVRSIMQAASRSPKKRDEALDALHGHLAGLTQEVDRLEIRESGFAALADGIDREGFEESTAWLEGANLSTPELAAFATGLEFSKTRENTRQWIGWLSDRLPMDDLNEPVAELMTAWTKIDYLEAGNWLAEATDSPGKRAAVAAYAETVAGTEPRTAVQWAMTLPDTWRREEVMREIHKNWPANDPDGAAAFAAEQGIK